MMIFIFGDVDLGNFHFSFKLCAEEFPFFVELDAMSAIGLIEVYQERISRFSEAIPVFGCEKERI